MGWLRMPRIAHPACSNPAGIPGTWRDHCVLLACSLWACRDRSHFGHRQERGWTLARWPPGTRGGHSCNPPLPLPRDGLLDVLHRIVQLTQEDDCVSTACPRPLRPPPTLRVTLQHHPAASVPARPLAAQAGSKPPSPCRPSAALLPGLERRGEWEPLPGRLGEQELCPGGGSRAVLGVPWHQPSSPTALLLLGARQDLGCPKGSGRRGPRLCLLGGTGPDPSWPLPVPRSLCGRCRWQTRGCGWAPPCC